jgi:hypothetical protein
MSQQSQLVPKRRQMVPLGNLLAAMIAVVLVFSAPARAELQISEEDAPGGKLTTFKMTVTPAAEPTPAFKYRLLPAPLEIRPGNAALNYERAFAENGVPAAWKSIEKDFGVDEVQGQGDKLAWYDDARPLKDIPIENLRKASSQFDTIVDQYVARAVIRDRCDWGRNIEELKGMDVIGLLLPELQQARQLSRALMLRARAAIADRDFDRAVAQLRMNYRLGQHVASDLILVSGLVGIAQASMGNHELIELIATEGSPNMYWALAELPRTFLDMRPAVRYELSWGQKIFPVLLNPEAQEHSPEEWARLLSQGFADTISTLNNGPKMNLLQLQVGATGYAILAYPDAKRRLIASGVERDRVERMPVGQVIAIDASREFQAAAQQLEKTWYVPFNVAVERFPKNADFRSPGILKGGYGRIIASLLLPALESVRAAQMRLDRELNVIQVVEAIRMHAAQTGALPAKLEDIKVVYVPDNPVTGRPFDYKRDGESAMLDLPATEGAVGRALRFEIKLAK